VRLERELGKLGAALLVVITILIATPGSWAQSKYKSLYKFTGGSNGAQPSGLIFDKLGNLYGTAYSGGDHKGGVVFELAPTRAGGWKESVLYSFCSLSNCADGTGPSNIVFDAAGSLFSTTFSGGTGGQGTVFKVTPNGEGRWSESVIYSFMGGQDGADPVAGLVFDQTGNLYGTTSRGGGTGCGGYGCGVVFELASRPDGSWTENVLHRFGGPDGAAPYASLVFDIAGSLYGTAGAGGAYGDGVVFKLTSNSDGSWTESILYSFCRLGGHCPDGSDPWAGVTFDQARNIYGTTLLGGGNCNPGYYFHPCGTVFRLTASSDGTWKESVLHKFNAKNGGIPYGNLIFDQFGNLYGTTNAYARGPCPGCGAVFRLSPRSGGRWGETVIHYFYDRPGAHPTVGMIFDTAGNLYGTTYGDGNTTFGSIFEITP